MTSTMTSQTSGRNTVGQDAAMVRIAQICNSKPSHRLQQVVPNRRPIAYVMTPQDLHTLRGRLQAANHQQVTSQSELHDSREFLLNAVETCVSHHSRLDQKCKEYYQAYNALKEQNGALKEQNGREMHALAAKTMTLQSEIDKADDLVEAADRRARESEGRAREFEGSVRELEDVSNDLAEKNVALQQDLDHDRERIRILEARIMEFEMMPGAVTASKDTMVHELDSGDQRSYAVRILELQAQMAQMEEVYNDVIRGRYTRLADAQGTLKQEVPDALETDSTLSLNTKRGSVSPSNGERSTVQESEPNTGHAKRRQPKRARKGKKLSPTNPNLSISCN
jgi:DNA repair exonuclease SbcCD ATPase subunit